jgi:hypothetical protein
VIAVVDVVIAVSTGRGSAGTSRSVVGLARGREPITRPIILQVVVVVVPGMLSISVVIAVAALRSMLEDRESPDESLWGVPAVVVVVAFR